MLGLGEAGEICRWGGGGAAVGWDSTVLGAWQGTWAPGGLAGMCIFWGLKAKPGKYDVNTRIPTWGLRGWDFLSV